MPRLIWITATFLLAFPLLVGCGEAQTEPITSGNEIDQFLQENPDAKIDSEEEERQAEMDDQDEQ